MGRSANAIRKGMSAEYLAKAYFSKQGYNILSPDTHEKSYDFIAELDNVFYRVQVKAAVYSTDLVRFRNKHGSTNLTYRVEDYDILAGVHVEKNWIYLFHSKDINTDSKETITVARIDGKPLLQRKRYLPFYSGSV